MYSLKHEKRKKIIKIQVILRKRPINKKELSRNEQDIVEIYEP